MKHVVMFSSGAGSAAAGKRVAERYGTDDLILLFADVNMEHEDNYRFLEEAAEWIGGHLHIIDNGGQTIWDVFKDKRFLANSRADVCSRVLKREPMRKWLEDHCDPEDTTVYLGFDWTEEHRLQRALPHWDPWRMEAPLCWDPVVDKAEALSWLSSAGIEPPLLTRMGFPHANCGGGCVKAGIKQFKKLLSDFPETFAEWEREEQAVREHLDKDVAILRDRVGSSKGRPLTLAELRERLQSTPSLFEDADWGGCGCMVPSEDEAEESGLFAAPSGTRLMHTHSPDTPEEA